MVKVCKSSGLKGTEAILAGPGYLIGVTLIAGDDDASVVLQDDPDSADGTVLAKLKLTIALDGLTRSEFPCVPTFCEYGIYATVTGNLAKCIVKYAKAPLGVHKHA